MLNNCINFLTNPYNLIMVVMPIIFIVINYMKIIQIFIHLGASLEPPGGSLYLLKFKETTQILAGLIFFLEMNLCTINTWWKLILTLILPVIHLIPTLTNIYILGHIHIEKSDEKDFEKWFTSEQKLPEFKKIYNENHTKLHKIWDEMYLPEERLKGPNDFETEEEYIKFVNRPEPPEADECRKKMDLYIDEWNKIPNYIKSAEGLIFDPDVWMC